MVERVCAIGVPLPGLAPDTPVCTTVHAKVAPDTLLVRAIEGAVPEHIVCETGVGVTFGIGLTVIVTSTGVPLQLFAVGVIV